MPRSAEKYEIIYSWNQFLDALFWLRSRLLWTYDFVSPDGSNIIDVVSEDQGANDPDPFWQHVSLRSVSVKKRFCLEMFSLLMLFSPEVTWQDNKNATIKITGMVGQHFSSIHHQQQYASELSIFL